MARQKLIHRRQLLKWSIPLAAGLPFIETLAGCSDKAKTKSNDHTDSSTKKKTTRNNNQKQKPNTSEVPYYNPKKKVLHYPGLKEKEKLQTETLQTVKITDWERLLDNGEAHFAKEKSGLAFEKLALRNFQSNPSDENLQHTLSIVQRAFTKDYAMNNRFNWRVHDLFVQLVVLDGAIAAPDKWNYFSNALHEVNMTKVKVPKRMMWIQSKELFDKKNDYITARKNDYMARLNSRLI